MSHAFVSIDSADLAIVTGGFTAEGKGKLNFGVGASAGGVQGALEGEFKYSQSNYESCLNAVTGRKDWNPEDLKNACGLPPSGS